jgi:hypothetical protein
MRKLLWGLLIVGAGVFLAQKTSFWSYAGTLWSQVKTETKNHVPTRFEIQRVRRVRLKLQRDFESFQRMEKNLQSQRKLLEAKETSLRAAQEHLAKVMGKKKEFELRLAQLEADEETLQIARVGTKLELDDSRASQIEAALAEIEQRHAVQRTEIELKTQTFANDVIPVGPRQRTPSVDAVAIREYLEARTP